MSFRDTIYQCVGETAGTADLNDGTKIIDDLGLDSLHRVELAVMLEDRLGFEIDDEVVDTKFNGTIGDIVRWAESRA